LFLLFEIIDTMPSGMIDRRFSRAFVRPTACRTQICKRAIRHCLGATLAVAIVCMALSGCGVFCAGAGASGGRFAGGCATSMRF
jgi:hypothetical protein